MNAAGVRSAQFEFRYWLDRIPAGILLLNLNEDEFKIVNAALTILRREARKKDLFESEYDNQTEKER